MAEHQPRLNVRRGLRGATIAAVFVSLALIGGYLFCEFITGPDNPRFRFSHPFADPDLVFPLIGCAAVCAGAGWASRAPAGPHRFAKSLLIVFLGSLAIWWILISMELKLTHPRYKDVDHPAIYASEALLLTVPPIVVAALLTMIRVRRRSLSGKLVREFDQVAPDS